MDGRLGEFLNACLLAFERHLCHCLTHDTWEKRDTAFRQHENQWHNNALYTNFADFDAAVPTKARCQIVWRCLWCFNQVLPRHGCAQKKLFARAPLARRGAFALDMRFVLGCLLERVWVLVLCGIS